MQEDQQLQFLTIIDNIAASIGHYPYYHELLHDPLLATILPTLSDDEQQQVKELLDEAITDSFATLESTKGGQYFYRFVESQPDLFWQFRHLNESKKNADTDEFQSVGHVIETEMFRLEGLLTQTMLKKPQGLGKTTDAFYNIVYRYFPLFGEIRS